MGLNIHKIDWPNQLVELVVVFVGITAAFMLEQWREDNVDFELEQEYLYSIHDDLVSDSTTVISTISKNEKLLERTEGYVALLKSGKATQDTAIAMLGILLNYNRFLINDATYNSIQNAGRLNLISSAELRNEIIHYYHIVKQLDLIHGIHDYFLEEYAVPYQMEKIDVADNKFITPGAQASDEFQNIIIKLIAMVRVSNGYYTQVQKLNKQVLAELKHRLE